MLITSMPVINGASANIGLPVNADMLANIGAPMSAGTLANTNVPVGASIPVNTSVKFNDKYNYISLKNIPVNLDGWIIDDNDATIANALTFTPPRLKRKAMRQPISIS